MRSIRRLARKAYNAFVRRLHGKPHATLYTSPGHFYSPIVDSEGLKPKFPKVRPPPPPTLPDIAIDLAEMTGLWTSQIAPIAKTTPFSDEPDGRHRYHFCNPAYGHADAIILRAMLMMKRPRRVVEVGSGWSSACLLDTVDEAQLDTQITFIEPYPQLLKSVLRGSDLPKVTILRHGVQDAPLALFENLEAGDILFVDSTHIVKTGSDVVFELTEILPRLKPGVLIHFHDIFYPFEYSYEWAVEENRSWNEVYALRSFLAFNDRFRIVYFNDYFFQFQSEMLTHDCPAFTRNSGGAIWIERVS